MPGETLLNQRYELVAQQGSGGMSVIYKALDRMLGRMVAIKILRPNLTKDPAFLDKFQQEARSVAMMSHPNIVTVHDVGSDGATHYIVMEMIEGNDLKKLIKARGGLPLDKALEYGIQICAGLGFAHRSQLVHADVKPQNILINREGVLKVTDFGIAQAYTDTMTQTRSDVVWGSPHYFAPEQARGESPTPASDVYSIGIVLFEMFTGRLPLCRQLATRVGAGAYPGRHTRNQRFQCGLARRSEQCHCQSHEQAPQRSLQTCRSTGPYPAGNPRARPKRRPANRLGANGAANGPRPATGAKVAIVQSRASAQPRQPRPPRAPIPIAPRREVPPVSNVSGASPREPAIPQANSGPPAPCKAAAKPGRHNQY